MTFLSRRSNARLAWVLAAAALPLLAAAGRADDLPAMKAVAVFGQRIEYLDVGTALYLAAVDPFLN